MTGGPLAGRVALVTGGAGSVGEHISRTLAEAGASVLINCFHSYPAARELAARLREQGHDADVLRASVARPQQVERMVEQIEQERGRLDILVNNAAAGTFAGWADLTEEHLDQAYETNVKGALWCARSARHLLARSDSGCIVNVSSIGASHAPADYLAVGLSKAALEALTRYLAAEFAADGIRVNTASAALIDNHVGRMFPGAASVAERTRAATPLGRIGDPADLAGAVLMLALPQSRWITGQVLLADGGLSLLRSAMSPAPELRPVPGAVPARVPAGPVPAAEPAVEPAAQPTEPGFDPVVVVGAGLAVPGASSPDEFWELLGTGAELFVDAPPDRWRAQGFCDPDPKAADKSYQSRSGFITGFRPHPALAAEPGWGEGTEFTATWLRHSAHQALAGVARSAGDRWSVCIGYTPDGSQHLQEALVRGELDALARETAGDDGEAEPDADLMAALDRLNRRILPFGGTGGTGDGPDGLVPAPHLIGRAAVRGLVPEDSRLLMVDTACSSSLYAIDLGVRELLAGRADVALCGGAFALAPGGSVLFSKVQGLSRGGVVRALDQAADGVLFSDGAGLVTLKRLSRALADGDPVLGVVAGTGLSADGKGKAIAAPSSSGQRAAISRALDRTGLAAADVDWVIAHATGTPAGDEAEFSALRQAYAGDRPVPVTSNKSLIGHTGWAAGVVSVIQALLALRHGRIPAQPRFTRAPAAFDLGSTNLTVPAADVAWPARPDRLRVAAVSGFGFGGTNAHLLVQEYRPGHRYRSDARLAGSAPAAPGTTAPITAGNTAGSTVGAAEAGSEPVVVGWSGHLPGTGDRDQVAGWARGERAVDLSFGAGYPRPPFQRLRMPAGAIRATDRTQLMMVECMQRLPEPVRLLCERHRDDVGVIVGHSGPTRNATLHGVRAYLDELDRGVAEEGDDEQLALLVKRLRERVSEQLDAPTEDSFPGEMPNVVAARLCNYFDLRGLSVAVDAGTGSLREAFATAAGYLELGDVRVALVAGVNGNALPSWSGLVAGGEPAGEGAFLFAVTSRALAAAEGLPVLADLTEALELAS